MWGGLRLHNELADGFKLEQYHTYRILMDIEGQSSNTFANIYWTNSMGWGGGGLLPSPVKLRSLTSLLISLEHTN